MARVRGVIARFDLLDVDGERARVDVHQDRACADLDNRFDRRDERVRDGDDLVAGADARRAKRQVQRIGAVAQADREVAAAILERTPARSPCVRSEEQWPDSRTPSIAAISSERSDLNWMGRSTRGTCIAAFRLTVGVGRLRRSAHGLCPDDRRGTGRSRRPTRSGRVAPGPSSRGPRWPWRQGR